MLFSTVAMVEPRLATTSPCASNPMKLREMAAPILIPTPTCPNPADRAVAMTEALIRALLCASTSTLPVASDRVAPVIVALAVEVMALTAEAPAPDKATPTIPPPIATEAAVDTALIVDRVARMVDPTSSSVQCAPLASITAHFLPASTMETRRSPETVSPALSSAVLSAPRRIVSPLRSEASSAVPAELVSVFAASSRLVAVSESVSVGAEMPVRARTDTAVPLPETVSVAPSILASTSLSTTLWATDTPMATATPVWPKPAAKETACADALIRLSSLASTETLRACIVPPSITALMDDAILLVTPTPAPETPTPTEPAPTAADPAKTAASIRCSLMADTRTAPDAVISLSMIRAEIPAGVRLRLISSHISVLA